MWRRMMVKLVRGTRVGLIAALVALVMLFAAVPASADTGKNGDGGGATAQNVTWE